MHNLNKSENEIEKEQGILEEEKHGENEELLTDRLELLVIHICEDVGRGLSRLIGCEPGREVNVSKGEWKEEYCGHMKSNFTGR
jgi:hypothetical protein